MNEKLQLLQDILAGSIEFTFEGSVLILRGYYTGKEIQLDLSKIDEQMLEHLFYVDETEDY